MIVTPIVVVQRPCAPGNWRRGPGIPRDVSAGVVHVTEGSAASARDWFNTPPERRPSKKPSSAHFMVTFGGGIDQFVGIHDVAFANGGIERPTWTGLRPGMNPNDYTVSVEHEGDGRAPWPEPQLAASAVLFAWLAHRFAWGLSYHTVPLHREIFAAKTCPGPAFGRMEHLGRVRQVLALYGPDVKTLITGIR